MNCTTRVLVMKKTWKRKPSTNQNPYIGVTSIGDHGGKSEKRVVADLGAEGTIASGALDEKSDGLLSVGEMDFRIECKATRKNSIGLSYGWLRKIREEAMETGRIPLLTISFVHGDGQPRVAGEWVVMPMTLFKEISDG